MKYAVYEFGGPEVDPTVSTMQSAQALTAASCGEDEQIAHVLYPGIFDIDMNQTIGRFADLIDHPYSAVLIAGHHDEALQMEAVSEPALRTFFPYGALKTQGLAANTPAQAGWVATQLVESSVTAVYLYAPAFHLPRAYLTQLKVFMQAGLATEVLLLPRMLPGNPFTDRPLTAPWAEDAASQFSLVPGEAKRVRDYTAKGDLASLAELEEYLARHEARIHWG